MGQPSPVPFRRTTGRITRADRLDHFLARWGVRRSGHRVAPGLWAIGSPSPASPVLVTAGYTLSFDALRSALAGRDAWILVLDTRGVNVWCAAGKGTFGTDELVRRIGEAGLADLVSHRALVLPQLGASGVAAREVLLRSGFRVEFGPVRAGDLPRWLDTGKATPEMRRVTFTLRERAAVIPVEIVSRFPQAAAGILLAWLGGGPLAAAAAAAAILGGLVVFPLLLPWLPTRDFSSRGFLLGALLALPFALAPFLRAGGGTPPSGYFAAAAALLALPPVTAWLALNFTGSTPFTSKTGVMREIRTYIPVMARMFGCGALAAIAALALRLTGI